MNPPPSTTDAPPPPPAEVSYAVYRVLGKDTGAAPGTRVKVVFLTLSGPKVSRVRRAQCAMVKEPLRAFFRGHHVDIDAHDASDASLAAIEAKLRSSGGGGSFQPDTYVFGVGDGQEGLHVMSPGDSIPDSLRGVPGGGGGGTSHGQVAGKAPTPGDEPPTTTAARVEEAGAPAPTPAILSSSPSASAKPRLTIPPPAKAKPSGLPAAPSHERQPTPAPWVAGLPADGLGGEVDSAEVAVKLPPSQAASPPGGGGGSDTTSPAPPVASPPVGPPPPGHALGVSFVSAKGGDEEEDGGRGGDAAPDAHARRSSVGHTPFHRAGPLEGEAGAE